MEMGEAGGSVFRGPENTLVFFSLKFSRPVECANLQACLLVEGFSRLCFERHWGVGVGWEVLGPNGNLGKLNEI